MGDKLLVWGGALFLVRYELRQLEIQRVDVEAEEKRVSLRVCSVSVDSRVAALPADAHLVVAKEVEDTELAIRYPVLVFQAAETSTGSSSPASRKRRRPMEDTEAITPNARADSTELRPVCHLFFYVLYQMDSGEIGLRFLNELEVPVRNKTNGSEDTAATGDTNGLQLQIFIAGGPYVLLFERCSQLATLLKLQRDRREDSGFGFCMWREQVDVSCGMIAGTSASIEVVSCTYVSVTHSTSPHILIHAHCSSSAIDGGHHIWSVEQEQIERGDRMAKGESSKCLYLPPFPSIVTQDGILSELEQITCCCFISQLSEWELGSSPSDDMAILTSWERDDETPPTRAETCVSTLLVTCTTSNTVYVNTNGIVLASFVLPARPVEVWCMSEDNMDQYYVLGVRCDNANRSFYMLGFSSNVQNPSLELLLSFNHVGHAYVVDFAHNHTAGVSPSTQALLLNDIPGIDGANICSDGNEGGVHEFLDGGQLVKRSVLITQKPAGHEARLSCHRLRLRDEKKSKNGSHSRKRSRNDEKLTSTGDSTDFKTRSFSYIERTQKASSRGRSMKHPDTHVDDAVAASHAQLGKLAGSFAARLKNGQQKLDRLQMIVNDKIELTRQLNQLIIQLCRKESAGSSKDNYLLTALISIQDVENPRPACLSFTDMETVVSAPSASIISNVGADENSMSSMAREIRLEQQIMLELFRVVEYVPSSSLVRAEVILNNLSGITLENSYAVLTAPTGESTRGWKCSCSVVPEFRPATSAKENVSGNARFQLEIQFAPSFTFLRVRRGLEAMLWLHWSAHDKEFSSMETHIPQTSLFSLAVASVKFSPDDLVRATNAPTKSEVDCIGGYASSQQEQEQLLFISSGSSLPSWFGNSRQKIFNLASSIVRPTFALVNVDVRERELMSYELSRMVTNLPSDVYVMHNPFQQQHLRALRRVLRGMRQEIQTFQQSNTVAGENGVQPTLRKQTTKTENRSAASMRRAMQHNTDLQVHQLLHALQNRVNFHTMWFDAANVAARE